MKDPRSAPPYDAGGFLASRNASDPDSLPVPDFDGGLDAKLRALGFSGEFPCYHREEELSGRVFYRGLKRIKIKDKKTVAALRLIAEKEGVTVFGGLTRGDPGDIVREGGDCLFTDALYYPQRADAGEISRYLSLEGGIPDNSLKKRAAGSPFWGYLLAGIFWGAVGSALLDLSEFFWDPPRLLKLIPLAVFIAWGMARYIVYSRSVKR